MLGPPAVPASPARCASSLKLQMPLPICLCQLQPHTLPPSPGQAILDKMQDQGSGQALLLPGGVSCPQTLPPSQAGGRSGARDTCPGSSPESELPHHGHQAIGSVPCLRASLEVPEPNLGIRLHPPPPRQYFHLQAAVGGPSLSKGHRLMTLRLLFLGRGCLCQPSLC